MSWKLSSLALASWHYVTEQWIDSAGDPLVSTEAFSSATLHVMMFQSCSKSAFTGDILKCSQKCRWYVSDNFQLPLKDATIYKTSRHFLCGALDTASISLMDWLSYSDSAVLLSLYRHLCVSDCALQAVVFFPLSLHCCFCISIHINKQPPWIFMTWV